MYLNTEKKKLTVWLVKLPKYLGNSILSNKKETNVGSLIIEKGLDGNPPIIKIMFSEIITRNNIPSDYNIDIKNKEKGMYIVSNKRSFISNQEYLKSNKIQEINLNDNLFKQDLKDELIIEGIVNKECFIKPVINKKYLDYKKSVTNNIEENVKIKTLDYFNDIKRGEKYASLRELDILAKKRKKLLQDRKRERLDKPDVLNIIFKAFEKHESWTVRDLSDFTGQPIAYIQEIVSEICVLNKKDHKNSYELKSEYKNIE